MLYALIELPNRVAQVEKEPFPVAPPLRWVECEDAATPETHIFDGERVVEAPVKQTTKEERNRQIIAQLAASDYKMLRALEEGDAKRMTEMKELRAALRKRIEK